VLLHSQQAHAREFHVGVNQAQPTAQFVVRFQQRGRQSSSAFELPQLAVGHPGEGGDARGGGCRGGLARAQPAK